MRAVLLFAAGTAVAVFVAWWVAALPGSVTMTIAGLTLQASTPVALTLLAALFLVLYLVFRLLGALWRLPRTLGRARRERNRSRGDLAVNRALVALAAHDPAAARREAERSRKLLGDTPLTLLLAAQAGRQGGRTGDAQHVFRLLAETKGGELLGLRGLLREAVENEDWAAAERYAADAEKAHPGAAWLAEERRRIAVRTGRFQEALNLAGPARRSATDPATRAALALGAAQAERDPIGATRLAKQAWEVDTALTPAALFYALRLREAGRERAALDVLRRTWALSPHPDLVAAYVAPVNDGLGKLRAGQELGAANAGHAETALMLAQLALDAGLTGEARRYLAGAAALDDRRFWVLQGAVAEADGDAAAAGEALKHQAVARPGPAWRCMQCGTPQDGWHPTCITCGTAGRIAWGMAETHEAHPASAPAAIEGLG